MAGKHAIRAEARRLLATLSEGGAVPVEADILMPADLLLDLYGEDIRGRAYVTADPLRGEQMLRPDFTVSVVQQHVAAGGGSSRYGYAGEVFRRQEEEEPGRAPEFLQVGLEVFGGDDPASAEADVFARISAVMAPLGLRAAMGDIGLLRSAVEGLDTTAPRRAALLRHLWRPRRFRALLDRYSGRSPEPPGRQAVLKKLNQMSAETVIDAAGPAVGLRTPDEVATRLAALQEEARTPPLPAPHVAMIDDLLALRAPMPVAVERLCDLAVDMPAMEPAVDRFRARLDVFAAAGIDLDDLEFEASYGRTTLEYYDGFVFGLYAPGRPELPPVASGGRYDALVRALGGVDPAVGAVIRPGLALMLAEGGP